MAGLAIMRGIESAGPLFDSIGEGYAALRQTEPRIATQIWAALGDAETVLNVGAGSGSYEPPDRRVTAVEPSKVMRAQRSPDAAPVVAAFAEELPFPDKSFDAAMAVLSDHHWADPLAGLREMRRVARRVVVFQWDNELVPEFWLVRDYLPEFVPFCFAGPSLAERACLLAARAEPVPIPWDCVDAFFHAYWRRPRAYLEPAVRRSASPWALVGAEVEARAVAELEADLASRRWQTRNATMLELEEADLGARLLVAG
jgi:SAM-dependent methyltransferase